MILQFSTLLPGGKVQLVVATAARPGRVLVSGGAPRTPGPGGSPAQQGGGGEAATKDLTIYTGLGRGVICGGWVTNRRPRVGAGRRGARRGTSRSLSRALQSRVSLAASMRLPLLVLLP
eukprot:SAG22_NODE_9726_length_573_cov_0.978903_2_plen_118_part_01